MIIVDLTHLRHVMAEWETHADACIQDHMAAPGARGVAIINIIDDGSAGLACWWPKRVDPAQA